ncbi:MAG: UDP-N-acetylmuramoyl-L-alanyl-D-glutamate--2,6-diaminopimelate ligase [Pseudomonadota bacterium]
MKLSDVTGVAEASFPINPLVTGVTCDSRLVAPGYVFAALPGSLVDGAAYIPEAERKGAVACIAKPGIAASIPIIEDANPRRRYAEAASRYYNASFDCVAGVTGTNGKTSTAYFVEQIWSALGLSGASVGTLGARMAGFFQETSHTTPEPAALHQALQALSGAGAQRVILEASSHALDQSRLDGVQFDIAAFSNITQDHLDYHPDFASYFDAKMRLFEDRLRDDGIAVVNRDGAHSDAVCDRISRKKRTILTTGVTGTDVRLVSVSPTPKGLLVDIDIGKTTQSLKLKTIGAFQAENAALAAGVALASGASRSDVLQAMEQIESAPGRMQFAGEKNGGAVYVDYAHTPAAIDAAIKSIRPHADGRLIIIIGAGGDRDASKRPLMGAAAAAADIVIVTDDNPRSEDPAAIRAAVLEGCPGAQEIADRADAIAAGVAMLGSGDVLLVSGKGHETGQTIGAETLPFSDVEVVRQMTAN